MSEWQRPPFTTSIQLYSMGIIWVPWVLQPILTTLKGHGILISAITSYAKHLLMESFAYNIAALTIWLPTYSPTEASSNLYRLWHMRTSHWGDNKSILLGSSPLRGRILCGSFFSCSSGRAFYSCLLVAPTIGYSFFHRNGLFLRVPIGFFFGIPGGF